MIVLHLQTVRRVVRSQADNKILVLAPCQKTQLKSSQTMMDLHLPTVQRVT